MTENDLSHAVIGAAIDVHRELGPGLIESIYEESLCHEFHLRGIAFERQKQVPVIYKNIRLAVPLRLERLLRPDHVAAVDDDRCTYRRRDDPIAADVAQILDGARAQRLRECESRAFKSVLVDHVRIGPRHRSAG